MSRLPSLSRVHRNGRMLVLGVAAVAGLAAPATTGHADGSLSEPTSCVIVSVGLLEPTTCSYVAVTSTEQIVVALNTGVLSEAPPATGCVSSWANSAPGVITQTQTPGCTYTLSISDPGISVAIPDPGSAAGAHLGGCADVGVACTYTALRSTGTVVVEAAGTGSTITATVQDLNTGALVSTCAASSAGVEDQVCIYPETLGHAYLLSYTTGSPESAAVAVG